MVYTQINVEASHGYNQAYIIHQIVPQFFRQHAYRDKSALLYVTLLVVFL